MPHFTSSQTNDPHYNLVSKAFQNSINQCQLVEEEPSWHVYVTVIIQSRLINKLIPIVTYNSFYYAQRNKREQRIYRNCNQSRLIFFIFFPFQNSNYTEIDT